MYNCFTVVYERKVAMKFFLLLILLVFQNTFANEDSKKLAEVEKIFIEEIKKQNSSDKDKFLLYNLAGRELYNYKFYEKSKEYFEKAIELDVPSDKTEAHINLIAIDYARSKTVSKKSYDRAVDYFTKSKKINDEGIKEYLSFINMSFFKKSGVKNYKGFYGEFTKQSSIKNLIQHEKYKEALSLMNPQSVKDRDLATKLRYDFLRSAVLGSKKLELTCKEKVDAYPHSIAWSIEACKALVKYQSGEKLTRKDIQNVEKSAKEQESSSLYLIKKFGDLK